MHHLAVEPHCIMVTLILLISMAPAVCHIVTTLYLEFIIKKTNQTNQRIQGQYFYPFGKMIPNGLCVDKLQN